ncbi:hypothetical protein EVAR_53298_1 [Eumeta japonica]|uniref:Uncharacterized protein n=1 Tax=Eumeta variegata TaxID=151549 RepID=A0A4C1Z1G6_EUMVA|nr:hypothetical protein EVAR_53298_1 [Eumeta japonica]
MAPPGYLCKSLFVQLLTGTPVSIDDNAYTDNRCSRSQLVDRANGQFLLHENPMNVRGTFQSEMPREIRLWKQPSKLI